MPPPTCTGPARVGYAEIAVHAGEHTGTRPGHAGVALHTPQGIRGYLDPYVPEATWRRFQHASWTSPEIEPGFVFTELVPSWHAGTPEASWIEVGARVRRHGTGGWSNWLILARWADHDTTVHPASVPATRARSSEAVRVDTDTLHTTEGADAWQLRVTLLRPEDGPGRGPTVSYLAAMVSGPAMAGRPGRASETGAAAGQVLDVPALSQRIHRDRHPEWGGGDVWCSPTCVAMVLGYWSTGPDSSALFWIDPSYPDRPVYHAVRHTWDYAYRGAGNWSFNVAYAATFGLRSFVTRLRDLTEAEAFIVAGIPLVVSLYVDPNELAGAEYASPGHLVVLAGFTGDGDVVVHDPGARDPTTIRRVYRRGQFEHAWQAGSGGIVYVIHIPTVDPPKRSAEPNW